MNNLDLITLIDELQISSGGIRFRRMGRLSRGQRRGKLSCPPDPQGQGGVFHTP